jgi:uncharacterized membrane protein
MNAGMNQDLVSWRTTTIVLALLSVGVFLLQRTSWAMFDIVFELCIFHIPSLVCAAIYLRLQGSKSPS